VIITAASIGDSHKKEKMFFSILTIVCVFYTQIIINNAYQTSSFFSNRTWPGLFCVDNDLDYGRLASSMLPTWMQMRVRRDVRKKEESENMFKYKHKYICSLSEIVNSHDVSHLMRNQILKAQLRMAHNKTWANGISDHATFNIISGNLAYTPTTYMGRLHKQQPPVPGTYFESKATCLGNDCYVINSTTALCANLTSIQKAIYNTEYLLQVVRGERGNINDHFTGNEIQRPGRCIKCRLTNNIWECCWIYDFVSEMNNVWQMNPMIEPPDIRKTNHCCETTVPPFIEGSMVETSHCYNVVTPPPWDDVSC
jgi:hypothetical protein